MNKDIRGSIRQVVSNDSARAIVATAAGELIKTLAAPRNHSAQRDPRIVASGLGGFAAGAGTVTLATAAVRKVGKLVGGRRRPLFAGASRKAAAGTRKAVEGPREAVDAFASGLRDRISGRGQEHGGGRAEDSPRRPAHAASRTRARSTSAKKPTRRPSATGSGTTKARSSRASSARGAKTTRSANGSSARTSAKSTRSTNGTSRRSTAKTGRTATGRSGQRSSGRS
jgi:hypothetical protein